MPHKATGNKPGRPRKTALSTLQMKVLESDLARPNTVGAILARELGVTRQAISKCRNDPHYRAALTTRRAEQAEVESWATEIRKRIEILGTRQARRAEYFREGVQKEIRAIRSWTTGNGWVRMPNGTILIGEGEYLRYLNDHKVTPYEDYIERLFDEAETVQAGLERELEERANLGRKSGPQEE